MLFGRSESYNYSTIHVQVNSIPKGITTHVQNKRSDFNRGYFNNNSVARTKAIVSARTNVSVIYCIETSKIFFICIKQYKNIECCIFK